MGIQQYDEIVNLGGRKNESLPFLSVHPLDSAHIVGYNSGQYSERVYRTPAYEIYEVESGVIKDTIKLFNKIELRTGDDVYRSRVFLSVQDCMKPDNSRLACGMFYMPVFNIIDPHTKQVHGIRIKGTKSFSAKNRIVLYIVEKNLRGKEITQIICISLIGKENHCINIYFRSVRHQ